MRLLGHLSRLPLSLSTVDEFAALNSSLHIVWPFLCLPCCYLRFDACCRARTLGLALALARTGVLGVQVIRRVSKMKATGKIVDLSKNFRGQCQLVALPLCFPSCTEVRPWYVRPRGAIEREGKWNRIAALGLESTILEMVAFTLQHLPASALSARSSTSIMIAAPFLIPTSLVVRPRSSLHALPPTPTRSSTSLLHKGMGRIVQFGRVEPIQLQSGWNCPTAHFQDFLPPHHPALGQPGNKGTIGVRSGGAAPQRWSC